jgi:Ca2+-transporting ATPase
MDLKLKGLTNIEVDKRLKQDGYNELPYQKKQSILIILLNVLREPMLLLLLGSGLIYLLLGEAKDAYMLLAFVIVVVGITFYQERKTERALDALKNLSSPRALVIRNGEQIRIPGREVVVDDILILREGDRVPADAVVLSSTNLLVDESLLTGESLSVRKTVWDKKTKLTHPGGEDLPFVFSGTLVIQGRGIARVTSIGIKTEMGKIGKSLQKIEDEDTLLKKETEKIVRNFTIAGIILCVIVVVLYGLTRGNWMQGFLSGLTLTMAMLPEEFPVVLLIFLALGAWRISKKNVLTRKTPAIETLGSATVLCVDKTGTLTLNQMRLNGIMNDSYYFDLSSIKETIIPDKYHSLFEYSILASQKDPFDPLEKEIKIKGEKYLASTEHIHKDWKLIKEYPLSKELLSLSHVWQSPDKSQYVIAAKGAPEAIAELCHLSAEEKKKLQENIQTMANKGLRLIGVAKALFNKKDLPNIQHDFSFEYIGLLGFTDPVRSTIPQAIKECHNAGIRVIMITGDYPGTAQYIASEIGLSNPEKYISGTELQKMNHLELREKIKTTNIFARVIPDQKLAIVNALKANGEIVVMTGDGVNDAPAIKSAHIGIAMGERGTDVARETADLILLDDNFSSIVHAIRLGRRIFDNLRKAMAFIFSVHIPIAGMSLFPILFQLPIVFFPAHIAFLELIIDPACSIVFESEKEEHNVMMRPPRNLKQPLFNRQTFFISLLQGLSILTLIIIIYLLALRWGLGEKEARSFTFVTIVFCNLILIITNLSKTEHFVQILKNKNKALYWVIGGTILFLGCVLYIPFLRNLFHFSYLHPNDLLIGFGLSLLSLIWFEAIKFFKPHWM